MSSLLDWHGDKNWAFGNTITLINVLLGRQARTKQGCTTSTRRGCTEWAACPCIEGFLHRMGCMSMHRGLSAAVLRTFSYFTSRVALCWWSPKASREGQVASSPLHFLLTFLGVIAPSWQGLVFTPRNANCMPEHTYFVTSEHNWHGNFWGQIVEEIKKFFWLREIQKMVFTFLLCLIF